MRSGLLIRVVEDGPSCLFDSDTMTRLHTTLSSLLAATVFSMAGGITTQAHAQGATPAADAPAASDNVPSLKGKRIGITAAGTDHYWDLKASPFKVFVR
jgi:hypothetical protein